MHTSLCLFNVHILRTLGLVDVSEVFILSLRDLPNPRHGARGVSVADTAQCSVPRRRARKQTNTFSFSTSHSLHYYYSYSYNNRHQKSSMKACTNIVFPANICKVQSSQVDSLLVTDGKARGAWRLRYYLEEITCVAGHQLRGCRCAAYNTLVWGQGCRAMVT